MKPPIFFIHLCSATGDIVMMSVLAARLNSPEGAHCDHAA